MLSFPVLLGFTALTTAASLVSQNNLSLPGHYLAKNITSRTFFNNTCTSGNVSIRKEWRSLTHAEKMDFVNAELCLMNLPAKSELPGATTRFEDFQASHKQDTNTTYGDIIHYTPRFLAWHRFQMHAHETILKEECNYTGALPWWDEALDAESGNYFQSDMWSDQYFGGNGSDVDNCVITGPFANRTEHVGPLELTTDYCSARKFTEWRGLAYSTRANVGDCYKFNGTNFESFYGCMAYYPHIGGHQAVVGVMGDVDSSPGDPINATERLFLVSGNTTVTEPADGWKTMTLDYEMNMYGIVDNATIRDVSNIQGGYLCYEFEY